VTMKIVAIILTAIIVISCADFKGLYGIVTDFGGSNTETIVFTVKIDPTSGTWSEIVKNFVYVGSSATFDGISGYDSDNDVLYYATDFATPFLYSSDLKNGVLLAPIALGFSSVLTIDYDTQNKRLLLYGSLPSNSGFGLMEYSTNGGPSDLMAKITQYSSLAATAVDSPNQKYYVIGSNGTWNFGIIDLNNPTQLEASYPLKCNFTGVYSFELNSLYYDDNDKKLYAIGVTNTPRLSYWLADIPLSNPSSCVAYPMLVKDFGIATCFTYDQNTKTMWFGWAPNGPSRLISYDVAGRKISNDMVFSNRVVLEDLQVAYF